MRIGHARSSRIPKLPENLPNLLNVLSRENIRTNNKDELFTLVNVSILGLLGKGNKNNDFTLGRDPCGKRIFGRDWCAADTMGRI